MTVVEINGLRVLGISNLLKRDQQLVTSAVYAF
jgi:hypothetical protein